MKRIRNFLRRILHPQKSVIDGKFLAHNEAMRKVVKNRAEICE